MKVKRSKTLWGLFSFPVSTKIFSNFLSNQIPLLTLSVFKRIHHERLELWVGSAKPPSKRRKKVGQVALYCLIIEQINSL